MLGCSVQLLRVHVRNSNDKCVGQKRCALKRFDLQSLQGSDWTQLGRHEMLLEIENQVCSKIETLFKILFSIGLREPANADV